jgi:Tfp pilus assembly protein PilN
MIHNAFLSMASVAAILASVALLVVLSALTLAPFNRFGRYFTVAFLVSLLAIWAGAVFTIYLIKHTIV